MLYSKDQNYDLADLPQLNINDARSVFRTYDDEKKGIVSAAELKSIFIDMGYNAVERPDMNAFFENLCKQADEHNVMNSHNP